MRAQQGIFVIASLLLMFGCSSKPPQKYVAPSIMTNSTMPSNADLGDQNKLLQRSLKERNLYLTNTGEIAPLGDSVCRLRLLKRIDSMDELVLVPDSQFAGYVVPIVSQDQNYYFYSPTKSKAPLQRLPATQMDLYLDLSSLPESDLEAGRIEAIASEQFYLIVSESHYKVLMRNGSSSMFRNRVFVKRPPLVRRTEPSDVEPEYVFNDALNDTKVVIKTNPLGACQSLSDSVCISSPTLPYQNGRGYTLAQLVSMLPQNADFNQLDKQVELVGKGQYLTYWGKKTYLLDPCKTGKLGAEVCKDGGGPNPDEKSVVVVIGGGKNGK